MPAPDDDQLGRLRHDILAANPALAGDTSLPERLEHAYVHALELGFTDAAAIARFLHYEAFAPRFYRQPAIDAWLRMPGLPVEQRFADVLARVRSRLRRD